MSKLVEIPRRNGKAMLMKRIAAVDPSSKVLTQDIFKGQHKRLKYAAVDLEGKARLFINKPKLTANYSNMGPDIWYATHMAKKDTAEFRRKYARGIPAGEGYLCEIYTKTEHRCILKREGV